MKTIDSTRQLATLCMALCLFLLPTKPSRAEDERPLRDLNGYFPFTPVHTPKDWQKRRAEIQQRLLLAAGLWPMPEKTPLNPVIHGRIDRDDYTVDRVFFESLPGHFVTGSLYRAKNQKLPAPAVLCPHGHWPKGRFMDREIGSPAFKKELETGAETMESAARSPVQARCVQMARMGCTVFLYDMLGYADSIQFPEHRHGLQPDGFVSAQSELRLQSHFGLQTWNSIRALDFITSLDGIDPNRIACTGASGGATQTMMLTGLDDRIKAAFACVMVSTAMQGGCVCENANYLRINQGNVDIAALAAPRPLGVTAADDWTKELETKGLPDLKSLYEMLGASENLSSHIATQYPHNYNLPSRTALYTFLNRHFHLGLSEPIQERDFIFLSPEEATVWTGRHEKPSGSTVGIEHEKSVASWFRSQDTKNILAPLSAENSDAQKAILAAAWKCIVARELPKPSEVAFNASSSQELENHVVIQGVAKNLRFDEAIPLQFRIPKYWKGAFSIILADNSEGADLLANQELTKGSAVAIPNLYLTGSREQPRAGDNLKAKFDGTDYREFPAYTYGYNHPLAVRRAHDVGTVLSVLKADTQRPLSEVKIIATPKFTACSLIAAATLGEDLLEVQLLDDTFRFEKLAHPWDPDFVPGAVKYGDLPGLIKLCPKVTRLEHP